MASERGKGPSKEQPEPDKTIVQPGDRAGGQAVPDQTIAQGGGHGGGHEAELPGDTMAQGAVEQRGTIDRTIVQPGHREAAAPKAAAEAGAMDVKGRVFAGRFEVIEKLGEGGMGVVYRAHDREIEGREIALKVLRPRYSRNAKFRELFFREIHAAQGFVSEHVVQVRDTGKSTDGTLFLTMDLVDGEPLDKLLERESMLNERHALEIARQTLVALASGHEQGFVHRDVKPSNVMLARHVPKTDDNPFGVGVRLLDFGIAGLTAQLEEGQAIGTPRYMSPEQVQGQRLDGRSDLFAVGILLYEMLSGSRPFDGQTLEECRTSVLETNVAPLITELRNLSDPIRTILTKALQKNRDKRFQSAADFIRAIEKSRAFREKRGMPAWASGMFFLSIAASGVLGFLVWDQNKDLSRISGQHAEEIGQVRSEMQGKLDEKDAELNHIRDERTKMRETMENAKQDYANTLAAKEAEAEQRRELAQKVTDLEKTVREQSNEMMRIRQSAQAEVKAVDYLDELSRQIAAKSPQQAKQYMDGQKDKRPIGEGEGATHIQNVVEAAAALDSADRALAALDNGQAGAGAPAAEACNKAFRDYREGVRWLDAADKGVRDFEIASAKWIHTKNDLVEGQPPDRLKILQDIRTGLAAQAATLKTKVDALTRSLDDIVQRERASLMKIKFSDDPTPVIQHARTYDGAQLTELVDRLGRETEAWCAPGGHLDRAKVDGSEPIRMWGEYLLGDGAQLTGAGADTFRWLWAARKWYANDGSEALGPAFDFSARVPQITDAKPHADWRAQLALQRKFAERLANYLSSGSGASVYRQFSPSTGVKDWYYEVIEFDKANAGQGKIARQRIDADGTKGEPARINLAVHDDVLDVGDKTILEVRALGEHLRVAQWMPTLVEPLPDQAWARSMNHQSFSKKIKGGLPCLVVGTGNTTFWFSPGYGIVRQEIAGVFEKELCFTSRQN